MGGASVSGSSEGRGSAAGRYAAGGSGRPHSGRSCSDCPRSSCRRGGRFGCSQSRNSRPGSGCPEPRGDRLRLNRGGLCQSPAESSPQSASAPLWPVLRRRERAVTSTTISAMPQSRPPATMIAPTRISRCHPASALCRWTSPRRPVPRPDTSNTAPTTANPPEPRAFLGVTEPKPTVQRWHAGITVATGPSLQKTHIRCGNTQIEPAWPETGDPRA